MVAKKEIRLSQEEYLRLKKMESRYRSIESIVAEAPVVIIVTNREHHIIEFNPLAEKITGYSREEAVGKSIVELISTPENVELSHQILNKTFEGEGVKNFEASIRIADGNRVDMIWNNEVLRDEQGNPFALVSIGLDLTDQRKMEKKLHRLSNYDSLTGMDNVPFFRNKLDEQLKQLVKTAQQGFFYILDIDNFRHINEVEGHFVGDKLLVHVADKIQSELGDNDLCARISGDSFLLYLHKMPDRNPEDVVGKIIDNVKEVWTYMDMAYYVTLSVGGAAFPQDGTDFFTLMKHADIALTYAKETG
ncbi:MAG TPA: hypothetical protein DHN33_06735, partial [Eubacteriaceae bacterium]|nr:hypothetical protein [Eubacteriaceae bacterium]